MSDMNTYNTPPNRRREDRRSNTDRRGSEGERRAGHKQAQRGGSIGTLLFLTIISVLALSIFVAFQTDIGDDINWQKLFFLKDKEDHSFKMGGVRLGMSQESVQKLHTNIEIKSIGHGETLTSFAVDGGNYTVWFIELNDQKKAYRLRYDQTFSTRSEASILDQIGDKYGKPGTSDCVKTGFDPRKCHFLWWPAGGISLNVITTEIEKAGAPNQTQVTMIATDTYLDGKRMRLRNQPVTVEPSTKSQEKLPF